MRSKMRWILAASLLAALTLLSGCAQVSEAKHKISEPYKKVKIAEPDLYKVTLAASAAKRLDVVTVPVREARSKSGAVRKVVPYASLIYDNNGNTWNYTSTESLVYVRKPIKIDYIEGDVIYLLDGPPVGTPVVTNGAMELYGIEFGLGK